MMEACSYFVGILVAMGAVLLIAFPDRLTMALPARKKKLHGYHWGIYNGRPLERHEADEGIECHEPSRQIRAVVGSRSYSGGKTISLRS